MQSEEVKTRFGRCPYCRAMIYQDPNAVIFYCSKCRTPIRGKNPKPTDETEYALSQLEILSADTASVFSDDLETPSQRTARVVDDEQWSTPYRNFKQSSSSHGPEESSSLPYRPLGSVRTGRGSNRDEPTKEESTGSPLRSRVAELRPSSRRTRRSMSGDVNVQSNGGFGTDSESDTPASAASYRRRASPLSSQELDPAAAMDMTGLDPSYVTRSALSDPAFQQDLLRALDNLRKLIAVVDQPRGLDAAPWHDTGAARMSASYSESGGGGGARTMTRRSSRLMRRLESQLVQALPAERLPRNASASSSSSSSSASGSRRGGIRAARARHCRPLLGGTPFVVCDECSEILQLPADLPAGRVARLQCGACGEALTLTLPASASASGSATGRPKKIFSAPQPAVRGVEDTTEDYHPVSRRSSLSSEQTRPAGPLHRVLGYSSVSSVLRSRRYGDEHD